MHYTFRCVLYAMNGTCLVWYSLCESEPATFLLFLVHSDKENEYFFSTCPDRSYFFGRQNEKGNLFYLDRKIIVYDTHIHIRSHTPIQSCFVLVNGVKVVMVARCASTILPREVMWQHIKCTLNLKVFLLRCGSDNFFAHIRLQPIAADIEGTYNHNSYTLYIFWLPPPAAMAYASCMVYSVQRTRTLFQYMVYIPRICGSAIVSVPLS